MLVGLATCTEFADLHEDDQLLQPALAEYDIASEPVVWNADVDWSRFDLVVIRNTWDYIDDLEAFLAWTRAVSGVTSLMNPASIVEWNSDKTYLRELAAHGVPIVPTTFIEPGTDPAAWVLPADVEFVVKPTVSCGSRDTIRYSLGADVQAPRDHIARVNGEGRTIMVQPYLSAVDTVGETAMLFFNGEFSHSIRKGPLLRPDIEAERVSGLFVQEQIDARIPSRAERDLADQVLALVPGGPDATLYARVDVIPDDDGQPRLLELELTEPSVFLMHDNGAANRFARAIAERMD